MYSGEFGPPSYHVAERDGEVGALHPDVCGG
jgi:hypothetical protein